MALLQTDCNLRWTDVPSSIFGLRSSEEVGAEDEPLNRNFTFAVVAQTHGATEREVDARKQKQKALRYTLL